MNIKDIQLLYDYHYWTATRILGTAGELSHEQVMQPTGFSWGSLHGTLVHTLDSSYLWRHILQHGIVLEERLKETESFPTLDSIIGYWEKEEQAMRDYLNGLSDADMESIVQYDIPEGQRRRVLWHCLVHVVNHGTQHFSECAQMLTQFGNSPGDLDMTRFLNIRAGIED